MHCNGRVLKWCGRSYVGLEARCGHLEVQVPPGCYIIRAGESMRVDAHGGVIGNHMSDHAVVTACCDEETCVTLFAPSLHNCVHGVTAAVAGAIAVDKIPADVGRNALEALKALSERLPRSNFDYAALPVMDALLKGVDTPRQPTEEAGRK